MRIVRIFLYALVVAVWFVIVEASSYIKIAPLVDSLISLVAAVGGFIGVCVLLCYIAKIGRRYVCNNCESVWREYQLLNYGPHHSIFVCPNCDGTDLDVI